MPIKWNLAVTVMVALIGHLADYQMPGRGFLLKPFGIGRIIDQIHETCTRENRSADVFLYKRDLYTSRAGQTSRPTTKNAPHCCEAFGAENETRTRDPDLGKVVLYRRRVPPLREREGPEVSSVSSEESIHWAFPTGWSTRPESKGRSAVARV